MGHLRWFMVMLLVLSLGSLSNVSAQSESAQPYRLIVADMNFVANRAIISRIEVESGKVEKLLTVKAQEAEFRISPQGDRMAYTALLDRAKAWDCCPGTGTSAFILDLTSGENTLIAENSTLSGNSTRQVPDPPIWSPDGKQMVIFHLDDDNLAVGEMVIFEGDAARRFKPDLFPSTDPIWSSDGTMLAYFSETAARTSIGVIFAVHTDGSDTGHIVLSNDLPDSQSYQLFGWIPGTHDLLVGRGIFYKEGSTELVRVNADDGAIRTLIPADKMPDEYALYVLDNTRALFATNYDSHFGVFWLDWDTGALTPTPIAGDVLANYGYKVFSPDQTRVAVSIYDREAPSSTVSIVDLTTGLEVASIPISADITTGLVWTPDGQQVAVATEGSTPQTTAIFLMNADGSEPPQQIAQDVGRVIIGWQT